MSLIFSPILYRYALYSAWKTGKGELWEKNILYSVLLFQNIKSIGDKLIKNQQTRGA